MKKFLQILLLLTIIVGIKQPITYAFIPKPIALVEFQINLEYSSGEQDQKRIPIDNNYIELPSGASIQIISFDKSTSETEFVIFPPDSKTGHGFTLSLNESVELDFEDITGIIKLKTNSKRDTKLW